MEDDTFVSVFSGIGGFDLPLERLGWHCVAQVEIDPQARAVLERHFPDVPRHGDVRGVHAARRWVVGQFDLGGRQMTYQTGKRRRIIRSWLSGGGPGSGSGPRS
jgi:hypothetical protein